MRCSARKPSYRRVNGRARRFVRSLWPVASCELRHQGPAILARLFELVIFDCDGVLVDSEPIACRVLAEVLTEVGLPMTTRECMALFMGRHWQDSLALIQRRLGHQLDPEFSSDFR